ncbi:MAG: hypothetical protein JW896_00525, partial [Deltaproteobacteria bacterium]|nr:hypothetical protein [Deltaproteobacteria bacterium]
NRMNLALSNNCVEIMHPFLRSEAPGLVFLFAATPTRLPLKCSRACADDNAGPVFWVDREWFWAV